MGKGLISSSPGRVLWVYVLSNICLHDCWAVFWFSHRARSFYSQHCCNAAKPLPVLPH